MRKTQGRSGYLLALDIGNTNITAGLYGLPARTTAIPVKEWRLATDTRRTADEYVTTLRHFLSDEGCNTSRIQAVAIASVVPSLDAVFMRVSRDGFGRVPFFVTAATRTVTIGYPTPDEIGADRIADAAAAISRFGGPCIVIDFGTATTFDCILSDGSYVGGVIAPGPLMSAEALAERTARLPRVGIVRPTHVIGRTTPESIQSGVYFGYIGLIREILARLKKEMRCSPLVIATGGLAPLIAHEIKEVRHIVPDLTLYGILLLWQESLTAPHAISAGKPLALRRNTP